MRKILLSVVFIAFPAAAFSGEKTQDVERLAVSGVLASDSVNIEDAKIEASRIIDGGEDLGAVSPVVVPEGRMEKKKNLPQTAIKAGLTVIPAVPSVLSVNGPVDKAVAVAATAVSIITMAMAGAGFGAMFGAGAALGAGIGAVAALVIGICIWAFRLK